MISQPTSRDAAVALQFEGTPKVRLPGTRRTEAMYTQTTYSSSCVWLDKETTRGL